MIFLNHILAFLIYYIIGFLYIIFTYKVLAKFDLFLMVEGLNAGKLFFFPCFWILLLIWHLFILFIIEPMILITTLCLDHNFPKHKFGWYSKALKAFITWVNK